MKTEEFNAILLAQIGKCQEMLEGKAAEYATDKDRLHNFKVAAEMQDTTLRSAVAGMMAKHTVSVYDMCNSSEIFHGSMWDEKITDHINYLILLRAVVAEEHKGDAHKVSPKHMTPELAAQTEAAFLKNIKSKKHDPYHDTSN